MTNQPAPSDTALTARELLASYEKMSMNDWAKVPKSERDLFVVFSALLHTLPAPEPRQDQVREALAAFQKIQGMADQAGRVYEICSQMIDRFASLPQQQEAEPVAWREVEMVRLIDLLRGGDGDSVEILCDNPDFNGQPNCAVVCCGDWTDWQDRRFAADTVLDALSKAATEKQLPAPRKVIAESNGHHWIEAFNLICCRDCGIVRRADDKNSDCKGVVRVGPRAKHDLSAPAAKAVTLDWVQCPICGEPDMRQETDAEGYSLIRCVNHGCLSNNPHAKPPAAKAEGRREAPSFVAMIDNLVDLDKQRTPGPWRKSHEAVGAPGCVNDNPQHLPLVAECDTDFGMYKTLGPLQAGKNARFIVALENAWPKIVAALLSPAPEPRDQVRESIPLADHDEIGLKVISQPWAIQSAIITITAHCTALTDLHPTGDVADLAGCISQECLELANALPQEQAAEPKS